MTILTIRQKDLEFQKLVQTPRDNREQNPQECQNKMDVHA
jgi:hypothetical protein